MVRELVERGSSPSDGRILVLLGRGECQENLQWTLGEWTRRHPITQGRWLSIMPMNAEGIIIYDPNTALSLLKECEQHWDGKAVLSENKLWIGLSI